MKDDEAVQNNQFQIELTPEIAQGTYANMVLLAHSSSEVILDFVRVLPGLPKANVQSRIILTPEHAKRLMFALQDNVMRYEKSFGAIHMPEDGPRTIAPFNVNGRGEA